MTQGEAKIRVRLDTGPAKAALAELANNASKIAGNVGGGVMSSVKMGLGAVGLGGAFGMGMAAVQGPSGEAAQGIIGESLGAFGAQISAKVFGSMGPEAAAGSAAREDLINAFGPVLGREGRMPDGATQYFENRRQFHLEAAKGRQAIEADQQFYGASVEDVAKKLGDAIREGATSAWDRIMAILASGAAG
jgi:hypothetical protein